MLRWKNAQGRRAWRDPLRRHLPHDTPGRFQIWTVAEPKTPQARKTGVRVASILDEVQPGLWALQPDNWHRL